MVTRSASSVVAVIRSTPPQPPAPRPRGLRRAVRARGPSPAAARRRSDHAPSAIATTTPAAPSAMRGSTTTAATATPIASSCMPTSGRSAMGRRCNRPIWARDERNRSQRTSREEQPCPDGQRGGFTAGDDDRGDDSRDARRAAELGNEPSAAAAHVEPELHGNQRRRDHCGEQPRPSRPRPGDEHQRPEHGHLGGRDEHRKPRSWKPPTTERVDEHQLHRRPGR